jgi:high-affinity K+ transport system ATPase subunit B
MRYAASDGVALAHRWREAVHLVDLDYAPTEVIGIVPLPRLLGGAQRYQRVARDWPSP